VPKKAEERSTLKVKALRELGLYAVGGALGLYLQITSGAGRS
jgi:hypothetical protein